MKKYFIHKRNPIEHWTYKNSIKSIDKLYRVFIVWRF